MGQGVVDVLDEADVIRRKIARAVTDPGSEAFPVIRQTVLDTTDPRRLAEFYRQLFGLRYDPGDEPPAPVSRTRKGRTG